MPESCGVLGSGTHTDLLGAKMGPMAVISFCLEFLSFRECVCLKTRWGKTSELSIAPKYSI